MEKVVSNISFANFLTEGKEYEVLRSDDKGNLIIVADCGFELGFRKENFRDNAPMCKQQFAQIDCRRSNCLYNESGGYCTSISPKITINDNGSVVCWTEMERT